MHTAAATNAAEVIQRLKDDQFVPKNSRDRMLGWLGPAATGIMAAALIFPRLNQPNRLIFDETYYAKDAFALWQFGHEQDYVDDANELIMQSGGPGDPASLFADTPAFVVHPPVGKWLIGLGEHFFGLNPLGWRIIVAILAVLLVFLFARTMVRLTRSVWLGTLAGGLLTLDGLLIVLGRSALLDLPLTFFIVAAFAALILDRDASRRALVKRLQREGLPPPTARDTGPSLAYVTVGPFRLRPWRMVMALCLGLAIGTKWSGLYPALAFVILSLWWDRGARRRIGVRYPFLAALQRDLLPAFGSIMAVVLVVYAASWSGWFLTDGGWGRTWAQDNPGEGLTFLPEGLRSWVYYHQQILNFHAGLNSDHDYQANPWAWLVQARPTNFAFDGPGLGEDGCTVEQCAASTLALGNPAIWWPGLVALLYQLWRWVRHHDWRAAAICTGFLASWAPWLLIQERTMFNFYAITLSPFIVGALVLTIGQILRRDELALQGSAADPGELALPLRTQQIPWRTAGVALFIFIVILVAWFFYPLWTSMLIPRPEWDLRIWFPSWF